MIQLANSGVLFDKESHTYSYNGKKMEGVTKMLRKRLFPTEYAGISQEVLDAAAARGTAIHEACEDADNGLPVVTEYLAEVKAYERERDKKELRHLASEYLVTDKTYFASAIDKIYKVDDATVDLGDVKTTSTLNKEYVSWQLSIYAHLFEKQNPDIKVRHLYAIHIRDGKCRIIRVKRKSDTEVEKLMMDEIFDAPVVIQDTTLPAMPDQYKEMQWDIRGMMETYVELKEKLDAIKGKLLEEMDLAEVTKWQGDMLTFTRKADSSRETFDTKRFKAEHPDLYREYTMITNTRGSVSITINK